jgi:AraC-like DNA-binding protein
MLPNGLRSTDLSLDNLVAFPTHVGQAANRLHSVQSDLVLLESKYQFYAPITIEARVLFDAPLLALRLPTSGHAAICHETYGRMEESGECWNMGLVTDSACAVEHHPGDAYRGLIALLTVNRLRSLLDRERCPAVIGRFLEGRASGLGFMGRTNPRLRRIADDIGKNPYQGGMAALYAEGKLYELLAETFTILGAQDEPHARISRRDHNAAMFAYDLIRGNLTAPLPIDDVARQVGLSQRRLAELFHEFFGASPFQCLTQWRLEAARDLLDQGELSVKQVAYAMGYAHVSSFSQAFVRQFGYPPRSRQRRIDLEP